MAMREKLFPRPLCCVYPMPRSAIIQRLIDALRKQLYQTSV